MATPDGATRDGASNPVVALCVAGMEVDGTPAAKKLFDEAWTSRRDDYDACIAAHFVARHQVDPMDTLRWHALAVQHAEAVTDGRTTELMASLYLNLGDAHANVGHAKEAAEAVCAAAAHLDAVTAGGYREFVAFGIRRLEQRLAVNGDRHGFHSTPHVHGG